MPRSLPNAITLARIGLAVVLFVILGIVGIPSHWHWLQEVDPDFMRGVEPPGIWRQERLLLNLGAAIFVVAAISDVLDGYIARRWNLTTDFGRVADPFADKLIVVGTFLFLVPIHGSGVSAWMVVLVMARESLVDGIRGFSESRGVPFPALVWGKAKIVSQSVAITTILCVLANWRSDPTWQTIAQALLYWALFATLASGVVYVLHARNVLGRGASGEKIAAAPPAQPSTGAR